MKQSTETDFVTGWKKLETDEKKFSPKKELKKILDLAQKNQLNAKVLKATKKNKNTFSPEQTTPWNTRPPKTTTDNGPCKQ